MGSKDLHYSLKSAKTLSH